MELILKRIKKELQETIKKENFKYKHTNNIYQEKIEYFDYYTINRKKHFLQYSFIYQKKETSLSFTYHIEYNNKNVNVSETHSLSDYQNDNLPGIKEEHKEMGSLIYKYEVIDHILKNSVDIEKQADNVIKVFLENYQNISKYAKNIAKKNS